MIRRLVILVAAVSGLGLLGAPSAGAAEAAMPRVACLAVFDLGWCVDNPIRKLPEAP